MVISPRKFKNLEMFCPLGAMKVRVQQKQLLHLYVCDAFLLASISPYISKVRSHFWLKFGMVTSIYGALMLLNFCGDWGRGLELNFLGFQIEENFWEAKF